MRFLILCFAFFKFASAFPEQGKWDFTFNQIAKDMTVVKSLFKDSKIFIRVFCENQDVKLKIRWSLRESACWQDYQQFGQPSDYEGLPDGFDNSTTVIFKTNDKEYSCRDFIHLKEILVKDLETLPDEKYSPTSSTPVYSSEQQTLNEPHSYSKHPVFTITKDGFYKLDIHIEESNGNEFEVKVHIEMKGKDGGYLSAANWPLLPFYGIMCLVYVTLGLIWLLVSFLQWRDLLRIQFWIGGVIFHGMLEMAAFYAEYSSFNLTGDSMPNVILLAELVSCGKRAIARMLVIIVSLGYGIVKPRLGPMLHRVFGVGILYFLLAVTVSYMRVIKPKNDPANQFVIATVPLAVLDSAICWWIFISLAQTTRTLRLRRNLVKLTLYRHFTNVLIFAVVASVIFMLYSIKAHHLTICFTDWKQLWVDDAYWKLLFTIILVVIMILWRPTNNNQRYAFSPLLDAPEDDDDEEEEQFVNDAYGVKMRSQGTGAASPKLKNNSNADEDLKWVEENIPASLADTALPILDSDEEIMTTRFELSKMQ
ncbi:transmembrane protein 87A [Cimex lectularius]|uniref:Transmembrane protein 87A n=1 Tax=Cimex lectularius TaxID=79782 RepID=A0A8I6REX0_CIMLE|nr:transmembrane protein 87A [Cimex lectularius]